MDNSISHKITQMICPHEIGKSVIFQVIGNLKPLCKEGLNLEYGVFHGRHSIYLTGEKAPEYQNGNQPGWCILEIGALDVCIWDHYSHRISFVHEINRMDWITLDPVDLDENGWVKLLCSKLYSTYQDIIFHGQIDLIISASEERP